MAASVYDWSTTANSNSIADTAINWAEGQPRNTVNNSARQMMARVAEYIDDMSGVSVTAGTDPDWTLTLASPFSTLANGQAISFKAHQNSPGAFKINVNGIGLKKVLVAGPAGFVDPRKNDVLINSINIADYNSTADGGAGAWILRLPIAASGYNTAGSNNRIVPCPTVADVAALPTDSGNVALLTQNKRDIMFMWLGTDQSVGVASDPNNQFYIAPASDPTGLTGAYIMRFSEGVVRAKDVDIRLGQEVTTRMNRVIEEINAGAIKHFILPGGTINVDGLLTTLNTGNFKISGQGRGASIIRTNSGGANKGQVFRIGDSAVAGVTARVTLSDFMIDNLYFAADGVQAFRIDDASDLIIENIHVNNVCGLVYAGSASGNARCAFRRIQGSYKGSINIPCIDIDSGSVYTFDYVQVTSGEATTANTINIVPVGDIDTVRYMNSACYGLNTPNVLRLDMSNGSLTNFWANNSVFDRSSAASIRIMDTGVNNSQRWMRQILFAGCFIDNVTGHAVHITQNGQSNSQMDLIDFSSSLLTYGDVPAVVVSKSATSELNGVNFRHNRIGDAGIGGGAAKNAAFQMGCDNFNIVGNIQERRYHTSVANTNYLVQTTADVKNFTVADNTALNVNTGIMQHFAYATLDDPTRVIRDNKGSLLVGGLNTSGERRVTGLTPTAAGHIPVWHNGTKYYEPVFT